MFSYNAATNSFGPAVEPQGFVNRAISAVNRSGSLVATGATTINTVAFDTLPAFNYLRSLSGLDSGVAFDATADRFYGASSDTSQPHPPNSQIIAYDTNSFSELYRLSIGENIDPGVTAFGPGTLVASQNGRFLALATASGIRLFTLPVGPYSPPPTPVFGTPRDMVFDHAGQHLYITTAEGFVWPYKLSSGTFEAPYDLGGQLSGADIAFDDSYLIVAQSFYGIAQGAFQKLILATGAVTNSNFTRAYGETSAWDVAIGSNGLALTTTTYDGNGSTLLRQIDLATGAMSARTDAPGAGNLTSGTNAGPQIHRSADGALIYIMRADDTRFDLQR